MITKGTCFYCREEDVLVVGTLLGHNACGSCFTVIPDEMHWEIHLTYKAIEARRWELAKPERERLRKEREQERLERGKRKSPAEMTPDELTEHYSKQGETLVALKAELESLS